jgi:glycosyltransferase involved in cell wall biosynthesis/thioredoxin-like negative regulator of GroEL
LNDGTWEDKAAYWQQLSDAEPEKIKFALEWSLAAQKLSRFQDVVQACDRILSMDPEYKTAVLRRAVALEKFGPAHKVSANWRNVCRLLPNDPFPFKKLMYFYRRKGRKKLASKISWLGIRKFPADMDFQSACLALPPHEGDLLEWGQLWQRTPGFLLDFLPPYQSVAALFEKQEYELVVSLCEKAFAFRDDAEKYETLLQKAMQLSGQEAALISHLEGLKISGRISSKDRSKLARHYELGGQWHNALECLQDILPETSAVRDDRFGQSVLDRMIKCHLKLRHEDRARYTLEKYIDSHGSRAEYWLRYVKDLERGDWPPDVLACAITRAYEWHPDDPLLAERKARMCFQAEDYGDAAEIWWALFGRDRRTATAFRAIRARIKAGHLDQAAGMLHHLGKTHGPQDETYRLTAWIYRRQRCWDALRELAKEWTLLRPQNNRAWQDLIESCYRLEDDEQALGYLKTAVQFLVDHRENFAMLLDMAQRIGAYQLRDELEARCREANYEPELIGFFIRQGHLGKADERIRRYYGSVQDDMPQEWRQVCNTVDSLSGLEDTVLDIRVPDTVVQAIVNHVKLKSPALRGKSDSGIALVTRSLGGGGAERQVAMTLQGLAKAGWRNLMLVTHLNRAGKNDGFYASLLSDLHVRIIEPAPPDEVSFNDREIQKLVDLLPDGYRKQVVAHYETFRLSTPAIVHIWQDSLNCAAGLAAYIAGVPKIILSGRTSPPFHPRSCIQSPDYIKSVYQTLCAEKSVHLCTNSRLTAKAYAKWLGLAPEKASFIHNGLDVDRLDLEPQQEQDKGPGIPELSGPVIGAVFRFVWQKNPNLWLKVAKIVLKHQPNCQFLLVGDGPLRAGFLGKLAAQGLEDHFFLPGQVRNVTQYLNKMDLFLMTSLVEGLPNAVMEAQAMGLPVVATAAGGTEEVILHGKTGWVVPLPEPPETVGVSVDESEKTYAACAEELAQRVLESLRDLSWRKQARQIAIKRMTENFRLEKMVSDTVSLYSTVK